MLANLYLHHVFDKWMQRNHAGKPFEHYADDCIIHCKTEKEAQCVISCIGKSPSLE
ncbi:hypothetical protein [Methylomicrobium agile]|uniref:hypothetical protein n=1 Tax=Methylomicrobium agile TaxID=39774 RepID=UPI000AC75DA0